MTKNYDIAIIGGGAAGFSAMVKSSEAGASKVALINDGLLGGTCVNVGCVPSKRLIQIAKRVNLLRRMLGEDYGRLNPYSLVEIFRDIRNLTRRMRKVKYEDVIGYYDVDLYVGRGFFTKSGELVIKNMDRVVRIKSKKYVIATGSSPIIPPIEGLYEADYYTSNTIWSINEDFSSILIIGGGAIGLEFAQALNRVGIDTYLVEVLDRVITSTEPELSSMLISRLRNEGVKIYLKSRVSKVEKTNGGLKVDVIGHYGKKEIIVDKLLVATGRKPNTSGLGLENVNVSLDVGGRIVVDKYLRTTNPNIYAAGDVSGSSKPAILETIAAREGAIAAMNILEGDKYIVDHSYVPVTVFTDPELSYVGEREVDVIENYGGCECRFVTFTSLAKSAIMGEENGAAKIVVDHKNGIIRGVHIFAPNSSEYIAEASLMLKHKYKIDDILESPTIFPSAAEIIKLAAQAFIRNIGRMPCCVE